MPAQVALAQFESCEDLRAAFVADARAKIDVQADRLRRDGWVYAQERDVFAGPTAPQPAPNPRTDGAAPVGYSDTNVQTPGVDEADVVETDGTHLYLLHGSELLVLDSWPPESTAIARRLAIEGTPVAMFVEGGRGVVFSQVYDPGDLGGDDACAWIDGPLPAPGPRAAAFDGIAFCPPTFTKVTLADLAASPPRVLRELYLEGGYTAARRHGDRVRVVVQRGWGLPPGVPEPWTYVSASPWPSSPEELAERVEAWRAAAVQALEASDLDDWIPAHRERIEGAVADVPVSCSDVRIPPPGLSEHGAASIVGLLMSDAAGPVEGSVIVGGAAQVYAGIDTLLLAHPDWSWADSGQATDRTAIHVFAVPDVGLETPYRASGFVPGVPLSQLAFDVQGGVIRTATTISSADSTVPSVSRVTTVRVAGDGIEQVGATPDLAPGERIFAARFLGDRGYVVTFRQVDPLFVVDLSDPTRPAVLGEVELPGFSEYLHPLGESHLLTIGRDADLDGRTRGVALRIFDVSNPAAPRLAHALSLPGEGWSPAESDHLAFTYDARLGALALPYSRYDGVSRSSLVVVGVDATSGLTLRGEVDHSRFGSDGCLPEPGPDPDPVPRPADPADIAPCGNLPDMRRGVWIDSYVYSISTGGVLATALDDLATPLAVVPFAPAS